MRHKTTYLLTLFALFSSATAYAADNGFYAGIDVGRDTSTIKLQTATTSPTQNFTTSSSLNGFFGGVHGGYNQFLTKQFVLGAELFWNNSNASITTDDSGQGPEGYRKLQIKNSVGASLLPGWQIDNNNRLYARLGWILSQFTNSTTPQSTGVYGPSFNSYRNGLEAGLGYLYTWDQRWDLRMEYDHANYKTLYKSLSGGGSIGNYSFKPESDRFMLGLDYNFGGGQYSPSSDARNWYLGVAAGRDNATVQYTVASINDVGVQQNNQSLRGYLGELHAGHDWQLGSHGVMGAEIFSSINSASDSEGNEDSNGKWREKNSVGLAILPGYQLTAANLLYGRVGYIASKFSVNGVTRPYVSTTKPGLQLGLGYSVALTQTWNIFGEYDYAKYASIHATNSEYHYYMTPTDNQYKFGVDYHF